MNVTITRQSKGQIGVVLIVIGSVLVKSKEQFSVKPRIEKVGQIAFPHKLVLQPTGNVGMILGKDKSLTRIITRVVHFYPSLCSRMRRRQP